MNRAKYKQKTNIKRNKNKDFLSEKKTFIVETFLIFCLIQKYKKMQLPLAKDCQIFEGVKERSSSTFQVQVHQSYILGRSSP